MPPLLCPLPGQSSRLTMHVYAWSFYRVTVPIKKIIPGLAPCQVPVERVYIHLRLL